MVVSCPFCFADFSAQQGCEALAVQSGQKQKTLCLHYYLPAAIASDSKVLFVCHGVKRNPKKYLQDWRQQADKLGVILIAPEFDSKNYPGFRSYNQGNVLNRKKRINPEDSWSFKHIEAAFQHVKACLRLTSEKYLLYGHSAGAQFVHRLIMLLPKTSCELAIAANPGSLTFPCHETDFPYGIKQFSQPSAVLQKAFSRKLVILLGQKDIDANHRYLNNSRSAKKQGANRLERGRNFFAACRKKAEELNAEFLWQLVEVPDVEHSNKGMASASLEIFKPFCSSNKGR